MSVRAFVFKTAKHPFRPNKATLRCEPLEDRLTPATALWEGYGMGPQHTALSTVASQPVNAIRWQTPVDDQPQYSGNDLLIHYGSPSITAANTVIVPCKTGASGGFKVSAVNGSTGAQLWTHATDYILPPPVDWTSSFGAVLTPTGRYYFAGAGGTVYYIDDPDGAGVVTGRFALAGIANYLGNPSAYNSTVFINTPLTSDNAGNIYFGFQTSGSPPGGLKNGLARIAPNGTATVTSAQTMLGNATAGDRVTYNCAPAISNDDQTVYVAASNGNGAFGTGALIAVDSTTLAFKSRVALMDPSGNPALLPDDGTASPTVGPDGDVYMGVLENPFPSNHDRGWLLHFTGDLATQKPTGAFGWDDTASIVPASMVASYGGTSTYLMMTKYNNYAGVGGGGVNKVAILDPNATMTDPITGHTVMNEVLTIAGVTPDSEFPGKPGAVREWCINNAVVDPATDSVLVNSEDGRFYRWDLSTNTFTQSITLTPGIGEAYTPTLIGADGAIYAINNAILFAVGDFQPSNTDLSAVPNPVTISDTITLRATVSGPFWTATGSVQFFDGVTPIGAATLDPSGNARVDISSLSAGIHHITAQYSGDDHFAPSTSLVVDQEVDKVVTTTDLVSSASPTLVGQNFLLTATVHWTQVNSLPPPTGIVYFYEGGTLLGAGTISNNQAVLNVSNLPAGTHNLHAQYGSDPYYEISTSADLPQQVNGLPTLGNVPSLAQVNEGQTFTFTAAVTNGVTPAFSLIGAPVGASINPTTGDFSWQPTETDGPRAFAFTVRLIDGATTDDRPITVMVNEVNTAPTLSGVPAAVTTVPGAPVTFTAAAADGDLINNLSNALTYSLVGAPANAVIDPDTGAFTWTPNESNPLGVYTFKVRVADDGVPSLHDTKTITITLTASAIVNGDLLIGGTGGNDTITVNPSKDGSQLLVKLGKTTLGTYTVAAGKRVIVHGLGGNDKMTVNAKLTTGADLYGEAGNDSLTGGAGDDRLFGGADNDKLTGGKGNDLLVGGDGNDTLSDSAGFNVLIGGTGVDKLTGGAGDDLLIAGNTDFDTDLTGLTNMMTEWTSTVIPYAQKITDLNVNGVSGTKLTSATVHDDGVKDTLSGKKGVDWFLVSTTDLVKDLDTKLSEVPTTV